MTPLNLSSLRGVSWKTNILSYLKRNDLDSISTLSFSDSHPLYMGSILLDDMVGTELMGESDDRLRDEMLQDFAKAVLDANSPSVANEINPLVIYSSSELLCFDYDYLENMPYGGIGGANVLLLVPAFSSRNSYVNVYIGTTGKEARKLRDIEFFALGGYIGTVELQRLAQSASYITEISDKLLDCQTMEDRWVSLDLPNRSMRELVKQGFYDTTERYLLGGSVLDPVDPLGEDAYYVGMLTKHNNLIFAVAETIPLKSVNKTGNNIMKTSLNQIIAQNKTSAIQAGKLEAGRTVNQQLTAVMAKSLPMMVRGYADSDVGRLVVANLFALAVQNFASDNKVAVALSESAVNSASYELLRGLDIPKLIDDVIKGVPSAQLGNLFTADQGAE